MMLSACSGVHHATDPGSSDAGLVALLWWAMLIVGSVIFAGVLALLAVAISRAPRGGPERPLSQRRGWTLVVAGGIALPVVVILAMVIGSTLVGREIAARQSDPVVTADIMGQLWWWEVRYYDASGEHIATTANEIHVPVGQPVRFRLRSDNVIHSFWIPNLQGKTDLIPGQVNETWVTAREPGVVRGICAEFCGLQHARMGFVVVAEPPEAFREWLRLQSEPAAEPDAPALEAGQDVFMAQCAACHTIRGTPAAGELGPDLTHLASRRTLAAATIPNTRGHLGGWITDPQSVKAGARMPPNAPEPEQLRQLLDYLGSLR